MISKLKYVIVTMILAIFVAQPVLASQLTNDDMAFAFGDPSAVSSDLGEMALLSDQEMKDTEGEFAPAIYAGIVGARYAWTAFRLGSVAIGATRFAGPAYRGGRIFQVMRHNRPVYRLDYHSNPTTGLHHHFGNMKHHRPWYAPWRQH